MRVIFMGTPDFAVGTLEEIIKAGHEVVLVVSQPVSYTHLDVYKRQDQRHADIDAVLCLPEVGSSRVIVDLNGDLVDSRKRMKHQHIILGEIHLRFGQNVEIL